MGKVSSRDRILEVGRELFSQNGFRGTSVRMIAKAADVNVASINYYFSSKEDLLYEVLAEAAALVGKSMAAACSSDDSFVEMSSNLSRVIFGQSQEMTNCMRLMLSVENLPNDESVITEQQRTMILAGYQFLLTKLKSDYEDKLPLQSLIWATEMIMITTLQLSLSSTSAFTKSIMPDKDFSPAGLEQKIKRLAQALINDLEREIK